MEIGGSNPLGVATSSHLRRWVGVDSKAGEDSMPETFVEGQRGPIREKVQPFPARGRQRPEQKGTPQAGSATMGSDKEKGTVGLYLPI